MFGSYFPSLEERGYRENNDNRIKEIKYHYDLNKTKISSHTKEISELIKQNELLTNRIANLNSESESLFTGLTKVYDKRENTIKEIQSYIINLQNENQQYDSEIDKILNSNKETFFNSINPKERAEIFKSYLKSVSYYDVTQYKGFVHIVFDNGYTRTIAIKKYPDPFYSLLPDGLISILKIELLHIDH